MLVKNTKICLNVIPPVELRTGKFAEMYISKIVLTPLYKYRLQSDKGNSTEDCFLLHLKPTFKCAQFTIHC